MPHFIARDYDHPFDLARPLGPALRLARLGGFRKLSSTVARHFADERLQRLFSFQAMYAGLAPQRALALYAVISYMDSVAGVFYPEGGMHAVPAALARGCRKGRRHLAFRHRGRPHRAGERHLGAGAGRPPRRR